MKLGGEVEQSKEKNLSRFSVTPHYFNEKCIADSFSFKSGIYTYQCNIWAWLAIVPWNIEILKEKLTVVLLAL